MEDLLQNMTPILTAIGIIIAWTTYRYNIISKRKSYLMAIDELLKTTGAWFNASYPLEMESDDWKTIWKIVYKVDVNVLNPIIVEGGHILGKDIVKKLVQFIQLVTRFNQYIDMHLNFVNSNYEKIIAPDDSNYKAIAYDLMKKLHTVGIGTDSNHDNPPDFPFLHKCFKDLNNIIKIEKSKNVNILYWEKFIVLDAVGVLVPTFIIFYSLFIICLN